MKAWLLTAVFLVLTPAARAQSDPNVVLVTLDGVRWSEVFEGTDPELTGAPSVPVMPRLLRELSKEGLLLGDRATSWVDVSNPVNLSLPGYQNIFLGAPRPCYSNFCKTVCRETFPEQIQARYQFEPLQVAAFASWERLRKAYARRSSNLYLNAGPVASGLDDPVHAAIDEAQASDLPPWNKPRLWRARYDRYTYAHALHFLKTRRPRFLYLSLLDSDEYGHSGDYPGYLESLRTYDLWIREIADTLDSLGDYGRNTLLIVTTDHGRGKGKAWKRHGSLYPESKKIWMYLRGLGIEAGSRPLPGTRLTHDSIRTLVESAFQSLK